MSHNYNDLPSNTYKELSLYHNFQNSWVRVTTNMYALDKMGFAVGWREGGVELLYQRLSCVQPALRVAGCEIALVRRELRAISRTGSPPRSRRQIASRFWCSVNFGLRPSLTPAFACARINIITTFAEL